jgi:hypothetical protein
MSARLPGVSDDEVGNRLAPPFLSSNRSQIPHTEKLTELSKVNKKIVGNRKAIASVSLLRFATCCIPLQRPSVLL